MGSDSPRYRTDCYHCSYSVCRDGCDDCSSCASNMASHRRLRRLEDEFIDKVYESKKKTADQCVSTIEDLKLYHNIYISYYRYSNYLDCAKEILDKMEEKKKDIVNDINNYKIDNNPYYLKTQRLRNEHEERMQQIKHDFQIKIAVIKNEKEYAISDYNHKIELEKKNKELLEQNEEKLNVEKCIDEFKKEKNLEFEKKFENEKNGIDSKYPFQNIPDPIFEYTNEEKNEKNMLLENIKAIKNYSYLPNYNMIINNFGLINDL